MGSACRNSEPDGFKSRRIANSRSAMYEMYAPIRGCCRASACSQARAKLIASSPNPCSVIRIGKSRIARIRPSSSSHVSENASI